MNAASEDREFLRQAARVISALNPDGTVLLQAAGQYELRAAHEIAPRMIVPPAIVLEMCRRDWLMASQEGQEGLVSSPAGKAWLSRHRRPDDPYRAQHLELGSADVDGTTISVVENESPLAWLRRRRGADGRPILSAAQFASGERLRADFTRAQMTPRVTSDWSGRAAERGRRGRAADPASALDSVVAARRNVERALHAAGPTLGSLLLDVCCFLTGLEEAEKARRWPRRSGKIVLQIALDRLAGHYGIADVARGRQGSSRILHWGEAGYRPKIEAAEKDVR